MSDINKSFKSKLKADQGSNTDREGPLYEQPFIFASSDEERESTIQDIPLFPIKSELIKEELKSHLETLTLSQHHKDALTGAFLGKTAVFPTKKDNRIRFTINIMEQREYFCILYALFERWAITSPVLNEKSSKATKRKGHKRYAGVKINKPRLRRVKMSMSFEIYDHPALLYYRDQFFKVDPYKAGRVSKCVPEDIYPLLTSRALAYLFLDRGFFYAASVDDTPFWESYSFRLSHLRYYNQISSVCLEKFGITLVHDYDNSHKIYNYNKRNGYTKILYVKGESREKLLKLIRSLLPDEFLTGLVVSNEYLEIVESRQQATKGLSYDYWFSRTSRRGQLGRYDRRQEHIGVVKKNIESTAKRERWLANGNRTLPEEVFDTQIKTGGSVPIPVDIMPERHFPLPLANYWPAVEYNYTFKPSFVSKKTLQGVMDLKSFRQGVGYKSKLFKSKLSSVVERKR
jgi:hypothetical protein|tara:strand:+ start:211 stop:1587 length:1377 start_codon:yes stop_codon:yes gene_type:complete